MGLKQGNSMKNSDNHSPICFNFKGIVLVFSTIPSTVRAQAKQNLTRNVVEGGQRLGTEIDGGRPLPHLLHQQLPLLFLQQLHEEFVRRHHKQQRELLQAFAQHPAAQTTGWRYV